MVFIHKMADGLTLRAQDKRGALAISPTIAFSIYHWCVVATRLVVEACVWREVEVVGERECVVYWYSI